MRTTIITVGGQDFEVAYDADYTYDALGDLIINDIKFTNVVGPCSIMQWSAIVGKLKDDATWRQIAEEIEENNACRAVGPV
jgi:hypothetical protein